MRSSCAGSGSTSGPAAGTAGRASTGVDKLQDELVLRHRRGGGRLLALGGGTAGRASTGLDKLQDELVLRHRRVGRLLVAWVGRVAQERARIDQLEADGLDLAAQEGFLNTVQRRRFRDARAGSAGMVGNDV